MARAHSSEPIQPFPSDIDREAFGNWLSGFTDGEGCFQLFIRPNRSRNTVDTFIGSFSIRLREDDLPILRTIRSYFGCGTLITGIVPYNNTLNAKPGARIDFNRAANLATVIVPHFERFPLRAKKARDFAIWKRGVALLHTISLRPKKANGRRQGMLPKWSEPERQEFVSLCAALKAQRTFQAATIDLAPMADDCPLFPDHDDPTTC